MFKKSLAFVLGFIQPSRAVPVVKSEYREYTITKPGKGQMRNCKPKASGAAAFKRAAKKRRNCK